MATVELRRWARHRGSPAFVDPHDAAVAHLDHAVLKPVDAAVVCDHDHGPTRFDGHLFDQPHDGLTGRAVESGGRLVAHQQLRRIDQRASDGDALLLAPGELCGEGLGFVPDPNRIEQLARFRHSLTPRSAANDEGHGGASAAASAGSKLYC
jgi:hypothetical protein